MSTADVCCPECRSTNFIYRREKDEYECFSCGNKWSRERKMEESLEEAALTKEELDKTVVSEELIPTFTPAFLSLIKKAYETKEEQSFWEWNIKPMHDALGGVTVTLRGAKRTTHFFPKEIIERMEYDEIMRVYRVRED